MKILKIIDNMLFGLFFWEENDFSEKHTPQILHFTFYENLDRAIIFLKFKALWIEEFKEKKSICSEIIYQTYESEYIGKRWFINYRKR